MLVQAGDYRNSYSDEEVNWCMDVYDEYGFKG